MMVTHHAQKKETIMPTVPTRMLRQRWFRWEETELGASVAAERREECRRLLAQLLGRVAAAERRDRKEHEARRIDNERQG
jgi:hypothetical protein